jgi:phosphoenolpyruvate-protein phosphotransferase
MTAERAVAAETRDMETLLQGLKQECMRERSADVRDIGRRLLANLEGSGTTIPDPLPSLRPGTVLVAAELLLSDALRMNPANVAALVTEFTGPASHVAILARARHIPAVCDIEGATSLLASGDHVLVDAEAGTVTVAPTTMQKAHFASRRAQSIPTEPVAAREPAERCATKDGIEIGLHANISRPDEARIVLEQRLDGVGLFRSEFLFLDVDHPPDLDVQSAAYSEVARMLSPRSVVIRTMDLGGEKIPRFSRPDHDVALRTGKRGLMYSLAEKVMFRTQIQAIHRAAQGGNVRIMFPMVMGVSDLMEARQVVEDAFRTEQPAARPSIGAMIETPAAVFDIHGIMRIVDFVSVGTNDLAHFILAMDRGSRGSPGVLSFLHPSVLGAMQQIIRAAADEAVPLSVCGEAAGDPAVACLLVGMGVRHLSMNPFLAARVRHALRQITLEGAQVVAGEALTASTARDVQEIVGAAIREATS